jgi:hypothetical protein
VTYSKDKNGNKIYDENGKSLKSVFIEPYDFYLEKLSKIQLQYEFFRYQVKSNPEIFPEASELENSLKSLDKYLGNIVFEYQERRRKFTSDSVTQDISFLPMLAKFSLDIDQEANFKTEFRDQFYAALNRVKSILLA